MNKLRIVLSVLLLTYFVNVSYGQDVILNNQAEVDAFDQTITNISGSVLIEGIDIIDLSNLSNITSIGSFLVIRSNTNLSNLDGLSNITTIGGSLTIEDNETLSDVDGLSSLNSVGTDIEIRNNIFLSNVDGFSNITSVNSNLYIYSNNLFNLDGLSNITSVGEELLIQSNLNLINLNGLSSINFIGENLSINSNDNITNIDGLNNLTSIQGSLMIENNINLSNLDGLLNVTSIEESLTIIGNATLPNLDGLSNITTIGNFIDIQDNNALIDLNGMSNITMVGGFLRIVDNSILKNCCGIKTLLAATNAIGGPIVIANNPSECSSEPEVVNAKCGMNINIMTNPPCIASYNGSLQIEVRNYDTPPFTYQWIKQEDVTMGNGVSNEDFFNIENLGTGTYNITVTTSIQDSVIKENVVLNEIMGSVFEIIALTTTNSSNALSNGSIHLTTNGGTPPHSIEWSGPSTGNSTGINDINITIPSLIQGEYNIIVSDDAGNQQSIAVSLLDETVPEFPCEEPLDIVILNDVSGSVNAVEYAESKQFFVDFLNEVNIGLDPDSSRASIIEWSSENNQKIKIPITGDAAMLQNYIHEDRDFSGGTAPHEAMTFGENYLSSVARPDVDRVLILSTDGSEGQISPSLVALADQYKAAGYHIITIAFDRAFSETYTRDLLRQVASIDLLAPGAPAYSLLDMNLARNIVNLYLCPIDPGSSATAYFNRDGALEILDFIPIGNCPYPDGVEVSFTVEALRELSLPAGTPISFYHNNPAVFGANHILTWIIPCATPFGTKDTFTVELPVSTATNIFAVLNDNNSQSPPFTLPVTEITELAYSNNIDNMSICTDELATLQAIKYTTTPIPICLDQVLYTIDICNISNVDAFGVTVVDDPPIGFVLNDMLFNDNGCATDQGGTYDIAVGCCVSLTLTYDASNASHGYYGDQDVAVDGPDNQIYIDFDGSTTTDEDVIIDGTIDCPSSTITFTKTVNVETSCDDAFVVYQFIIDNQTNIPLQGLSFSDLLPDPSTWVFQPYGLEGLKISNANVNASALNFIIDEIEADTLAIFYMDAYIGDWVADGMLHNTATLENVPDFDNGGFQILMSNTVTTNISAAPQVSVLDTITVANGATSVSIDAEITSTSEIQWTSSGDGNFDPNNAASTIYTFGSEDIMNKQVSLFISLSSDCGENGKTVIVIFTDCVLTIDEELLVCNDNGTDSDPTDDYYNVDFNISGTDAGPSNMYTVNDGSNNYGPFAYGSSQGIVLPADGNTYTLVFEDVDDSNCTVETSFILLNCSLDCTLTIDEYEIGDCDDNVTSIDPSDDFYTVSFNITGIGIGLSDIYLLSDGTYDYGPFPYDSDQNIILSADGNTYTLVFKDVDNPDCTVETMVMQNSCSSECILTIDEQQIGACDDNETGTDPSDDFYTVDFNISGIGVGLSDMYLVSDGTNNYGPFPYGSDQNIILSANGNTYTLLLMDVDNSDCTVETAVMQNSCSDDIVETDCELIEPMVIACGHNAYYCVLNKENGGLKYFYQGHLNIPPDYQLCDPTALDVDFDAGEIEIIQFSTHVHQGGQYISFDCFLYIEDEQTYETDSSLISFNLCSIDAMESDYCRSYVLAYKSCWTDYECIFTNGGVTANSADYVDVNYCIYLHEVIQANCTLTNFDIEAIIYGDNDSKTIYTTTIEGDFNGANCIQIPISVTDFMSMDYSCVELYITGDCPGISCAHLDCNVFYSPTYYGSEGIDNINAFQIVALQPEISLKKIPKDIEIGRIDSEIELNIFPIPTTDLVNIEIDGIDLLKTKMMIRNILGQVIQVIDIKQSSTLIDLSEVSMGVYYASMMKDEKHLVTKKIIKI